MKRLSWHLRDPDAYRDLVRAVDRAFPSLHFEERAGAVVLAGEFVVSEAGRVLDRYDIEIDIPIDGPTSGIPVVREVGGRIPRLPDNHVNFDGSACIGVTDEFWYRYPNGLELIPFLQGPVLNFFVGQSIVARGGDWPHGERGHGGEGVLEFYGSLVGTTDPARVNAFLTIAAAKKLRTTWRCPCGHGQRVDVCHRGIIDRLRERVPRPVLRAAIVAIKSTCLTRTAGRQ